MNPKIDYKLTVAVCTYNRCGYLRDTLTGLAKQNYSETDVEILVVNNNSTDGTEALLSGLARQSEIVSLRDVIPASPLQKDSDDAGAYSRNPDQPEDNRVHFGPAFRWVTETVQGLSYARNRALSESSAEYVLYIDDDVLLDVDFLENWVRFLDTNPGITEAGGPVSVHFDDGKPDWFPMVLKQMLGHHQPYTVEQDYRGRSYPHGGNMLLQRKQAIQLGGFNTGLGRSGTQLAGGEEKELNQRIVRSGGRVRYNPAAGLQHRIGPDRLTKSYFEKQARGIGTGDRNSAASGSDAVIWMLIQTIKLAGSLVIAGGYLLSLRPAAAYALIRFRIEVIKGYYAGSP